MSKKNTKRDVAIAAALLTATTAFCWKLMKKAGKNLEKKNGKQPEAPQEQAE